MFLKLQSAVIITVDTESLAELSVQELKLKQLDKKLLQRLQQRIATVVSDRKRTECEQ